MSNNLVYKGMKNFWYLFISNLMFILGNSILVFSFLFVKFQSVGAVFYLIGAILFFPNLLTIFESVRGIIVKKQETHLCRNYIKLLKKNMKGGVILSIPYLSLLLLCLTNLIFLGKNNLNGFSPFFLVVLIISILHLIIVATVKAELIISLRDAAKLGFYLISKYGIRSLIGVMMLFLSMMFIQFGMQYFLLIGSPLLAMGITLLYQVPLKNIVSKLSGQEKKQELMRQLL